MLSMEPRNIIVEKAFRERKRPPTIARELKCGLATVYRVIEQFTREHTLERRRGSGRPKVMDEAMTSTFDKIVQKKPTASSAELRSALERKTGRRVSERTVRRARRALTYHPVHASRKPALTAANAAKRLSFCRRHRADGLKHMVLMDEMDVELDRDHRIYRIKRGQARPVDYRHPGKTRVNVWGAIWYNGRSTPHFTRNNFNSAHYIHVLQNHLSPLLPLPRQQFLHDGAPFHWTHEVQDVSQPRDNSRRRFPSQFTGPECH